MVGQANFKKVYEGKKIKELYVVTVNDGRKTRILEPLIRGEYETGYEFNWWVGGKFRGLGALRICDAIIADYFKVSGKALLEDQEKMELSYYLAIDFFKDLKEGQSWILTGEDIEKMLFNLEHKRV